MSRLTPNILNQYTFVTNLGNEVNQKSIEHLNQNINRYVILEELNKHIKNQKLSIDVETSIAEYAITYTLQYNYDDEYIISVYHDKYQSILDLIDSKSKIYNNKLVKKLKKQEIIAKNLAFLKPYEIFEEKWKNYLYKKKFNELKKDSVRTSTAYTCYKCKKNETFTSQMQTRAADEPMTTFITCKNCKNTWKE